MNIVNRTLQQLRELLDNEYVSPCIALSLVLYAGMVAPSLPENISRLFQNTLFKLVVFFLIAYTSRRNPTIAIIAAVGCRHHQL